jgi:hypothetical protein
LSRSVHDHVINLALLLLDQVDHLVELGSKQVETGQDGSVGPKRVGFHNFLVLDTVSDVDVAGIVN